MIEYSFRDDDEINDEMGIVGNDAVEGRLP